MKHAEIFTRLAQRADPNIPILEAAMDEIAKLEAKNAGFSTLTGLMQKSLVDDTQRISELLDQVAELEAEIERKMAAGQVVLDRNAELEAENKRLKTDLSNCDGELAHYQADVAQQAEENARLLQANRDCVDHFDALKVDFDKQAEQLEEGAAMYGQQTDKLVAVNEKLAAAEKALRQISSGEAENGCIISIGDCIDISNEALAAIAEGK